MSAATAAPLSYREYPLKEIPQPHSHDVLCGRGGGTNNHIGNSHWRMLVAANKQLYITLPKRQKMLLSRSIVNAVRSQSPPGRFLQKDSKSNKWFDVGDQRAQEKTSQALREGAPDIRKKVAAESVNVESTEKSTKENSDAAEDSSNPKDEDVKKEPQQIFPNGVHSTPKVVPTVPVATSAEPTPPQHPQHPPQQQPQQGVPMQPYPVHPGMHPSHAYPGAAYYPPQPGMMSYPPHVYPGMVPMHGYPPHMMMQPGGPQMMPPHGMQPQQMLHHPHYQMQPPQNPHMPPPSLQPAHSNNNTNGQTNDDSEPIPYSSAGAGGELPNFDDYVAAPSGGLEGGGLSFGSVMTTGTAAMSVTHRKDGRDDDGEPIPVAPGVLEPPGTSFGNYSMMSIGTTQLDKQGGFSFGSMMSYNTTKAEMPDGGLEAIGTSFGSLSLDTSNRETLFQQLEISGAGPEIPPMLNSTKSTMNLLDCSDTESEDEESNHQLIARKSAAWEKMRSSVALESQKSKGTVGSTELMPPPPAAAPTDKTGTVLSVPETDLHRNFSAISAFEFDGATNDDEDGLPAPPAELSKTGDGDDKLNMYLI